MLNNIRLALQWPKEPGQFAAIALAHVWIAQDKWVALEFMKRDFLVGEQLVPRWHRDYQRVLPDWFGNNVSTHISSVREPNREITRAQAAQLFGQRHF